MCFAASSGRVGPNAASAWTVCSCRRNPDRGLEGGDKQRRRPRRRAPTLWSAAPQRYPLPLAGRKLQGEEFMRKRLMLTSVVMLAIMASTSLVAVAGNL